MSSTALEYKNEAINDLDFVVAAVENLEKRPPMPQKDFKLYVGQVEANIGAALTAINAFKKAGDPARADRDKNILNEYTERFQQARRHYEPEPHLV